MKNDSPNKPDTPTKRIRPKRADRKTIQLHLEPAEWVGKVLDLEVEHIKRTSPPELAELASRMTRHQLALYWLERNAHATMLVQMGRQALAEGLTPPPPVKDGAA